MDSEKAPTLLPRLCQCCLFMSRVASELSPMSSEACPDEKKTYVDLFADAFALVPKVEKGSPPFICGECKPKLKEAYEFRCRVNRSQATLHSLIDEFKRKFSLQIDVPAGHKTHGTIRIKREENDAILNDNSLPNDELPEPSQAKCEGISGLTPLPCSSFSCSPVSVSHRERPHASLDECGVDIRLKALGNSSRSIRDSLSENVLSEHNYFLSERSATKKISFKNLILIKDNKRLGVGRRPKTEDIAKKASSPRSLQKQSDLERRLRASALQKLHRIRKKVSATPQSCANCKRKFLSERSLLLHKVRCHPAYECDACGKKCRKKANLIAHIRGHGAPRVPCPVCGAPIKDTYLKTHMSWSHSNFPKKKHFKCSVCGDVLGSFAARQRHKYRAHNIDTYVHECALCPRKFTRRYELKDHVNHIHLRVRTHFCAICGKGFFNAKAAAKHAVVHTGEKNFACEVCHRRYTTIGNLQQHRKTHRQTAADAETVEAKHYVCATCGKGFSRLSRLAAHRKTHSENDQKALPVLPDNGDRLELQINWVDGTPLRVDNQDEAAVKSLVYGYNLSNFCR